MTRTARASHPRALMKDRSLSRNGFDSHIRKNGAGAHNWGSIDDEDVLESGAMEDEEFEKAEDTEESSGECPCNLETSSL